MGDRAWRFTDNTPEARFLRSLFENGTLNGNERPAAVRLQYPEFSNFSVKAFGDQYRIFKKYFEECKYCLKI